MKNESKKQYYPIAPITDFVLSEHSNNLYKQVANSSIDLAKKCADKINEVISSFNQLAKEKWEKIHEQDGTIREAILYMKDNLLNTINFLLETKGDEMMDNAVKDYLGTLKQDINFLTSRLNNLLGSITEGSTTMDAEIIDARTTYDGTVQYNIGDAIRSQIGKSLVERKPEVFDANELRRTGYFYVSSSDNWSNIPGGVQAGLLINFDGGSNTRLYQQFYNYWGELYIRNKTGGSWNKWALLNNKADNVNFVLKTGSMHLETPNLNNVVESGMYRLSSTQAYVNCPTIAGLLLVYSTGTTNQLYQMLLGYEGKTYTRCYVNQKWTEWVSLATTNTDTIDKTITEAKEYIISKESSEVLNIYKKGSKGYIKYRFGKHKDSSINLDTYKLLTIDLCDNSKNITKAISSIGFDNEGVVLLEGDSDHLGGVHGDEVSTGYLLFVDGKEYTLDSIPDLDCNEIKFIVNSTIYNQDSTNKGMNRTKQITFDRNGVHIKNKWTCLKDLSITSIRSCMLSINKTCFTHIYDSNVNTYPISKDNLSELYTDKNIVDLYYIGEITAYHYAGIRGGNVDMYSTIIQDYGTRIKSYFNCYDGYKAKTNESLIAENHFKIDC